MTSEQLISEGRRLQRPTIMLMPHGTGEVAAIWHGRRGQKNSDDAFHHWISINAKLIPRSHISGWLSIYTNKHSREGGKVETHSAMPETGGLRLHALEISLLPPVDAVIARGSPAVEEWLDSNKWKREWRYNNNFRDRAVVERYEAVGSEEYSRYLENAYATLGGWHRAWPDDDWHELIECRLLVQTYMDAEPWVEAWQLPSGAFKVIQRIT